MNSSLIIIVTGPPGSGKTTLAKQLAKELKLPLISRDTLKERLYETLTHNEPGWDKKLGSASYEILYSVCESLLAGNTSFIVESNFKPKYSNTKFIVLKEQYNFMPVQIHCSANLETLYQRFTDRIKSGVRHQGHSEANISYEEFKNTLYNSQHDPLDIGGKLIKIDTNDFKTVNIDAIVQAIK